MLFRVLHILTCLLTIAFGLTLKKAEKFKVPSYRHEENPAFWREVGEDILKLHLKTQYKSKRHAKNIILFIGDGMGLTTVTAARVFKGQQQVGQSGEEAKLHFETFPHASFAKTYCVNTQTPDSAATATAIMTGVKTNKGVVGVTSQVGKGNCTASLDPSTHLSSIAQWAQEWGKWTGVVTTARITHGTPASAYARVADRGWEASVDMDVPNADKCKDIGYQLINEEPGKSLRVIMGGGRSNLLPKEEGGKRRDGTNLIEQWKRRTGPDGAYVHNTNQLLDKAVLHKQYLLGLFNDDHMTYELDRDATEEPSLAEMTTTAIKFLSRSKQGFFLLVEGGMIDVSHHFNQAAYALQETVSMDEAVKAAAAMTSEDDTLILVTADHSHVFTIAGYPARGTNILGIAGVEDDRTNFTFPILSYATGPGAPKERKNLTFEDTVKKSYVHLATSYLIGDTHGGEDVGVYTRGPMAHIFNGVYEQNFIAHALAYAACIGKYRSACDEDSSAAEELRPWMFFWLMTGILHTTYKGCFL